MKRSREIARNVRSGDADIGVAAGNVDLTGLQVYPFRRDSLVLLVHLGHPFAAYDNIDFVNTLDEAYVGLDEGAAIQLYIQKQALFLGKKISLRATLRSFDGVIKMVAAGAGVAIVPASAVVQATHADIQVVKLKDAWAIRDLVVCAQESHTRPALTTALIETLLQVRDSPSP